MICVINRYTRHKFVSQIRRAFIYSPTREIQIYVLSCMANSPKKVRLPKSLGVLNFRLI